MKRQVSQTSRSGSQTPSKTKSQRLELPVAEQLLNPLERHLRTTGVAPDDPGNRLLKSLADNYRSAAASARERSRSPNKRGSDSSLVANFAIEDDDILKQELEQYHELQCFYATRVLRPEAQSFDSKRCKTQSNYAKKRSLEKRGKLLVYNKMDDEHTEADQGSDVERMGRLQEV